MYDTLAPRYDRMHRRWLRHAGGEAQAALEACLLTRLAPGARVLDAGCGTGQLARSLQRRFRGGLSLTLLDASRAMLAQTEDVAAEHVHGSLLDMPFGAQHFDIAVSCWAIEATADPATAIAELMRVVAPGGHVLVAFCATEPSDALAASFLRKTVEWRGTGRFLDTASVEAAFWDAGAASVTRHSCHGPAAVMDVAQGHALRYAA